MFNPLAADELTMMLSGVLRGSARWDRPLEPFETTQLLSASSIARYLSAELADGAAALRTFRGALAADLRAELGQASGAWADAVRRCLDGLDTDDPRELGALIGALLDAGRGQPGFDRFRPVLHARLRELAAAEVAILGGAGKSGGRQ